MQPIITILLVVILNILYVHCTLPKQKIKYSFKLIAGSYPITASSPITKIFWKQILQVDCADHVLVIYDNINVLLVVDAEARIVLG